MEPIISRVAGQRVCGEVIIQGGLVGKQNLGVAVP